MISVVILLWDIGRTGVDDDLYQLLCKRGGMAGRWHPESSECRLCAAACEERNKGSVLL